MNYLISILITALIIIFLFAKSLYDDNKQLKEANELIISGYETSIKILEDKYKFEKEMIIEKEPVIKASERVKIENEKRGVIDEKSLNNDFVIVNF